MTGRSKSLTIADLKRIHQEILHDARRNGAGPIADHYAEAFKLALREAEKVAK